MKKNVLLLLLWMAMATAMAQTVIDLKPGGGVRAKTVDDYRKEDKAMEQRVHEDSLTYNDCLTRAFNAVYRDSLEEAERLLNQCLDLRPAAASNYIVRHYLGRISMARGDYRKALGQLSPLLKERPEDREVRLERASCYLEVGNPNAALEDCRSLLASAVNEQDRMQSLFLRIAVNMKLRRPDLVKKDLEDILHMDPVNESALLLMPAILVELGQPAEAMQRLNTFVAAHPHVPDGYAARAELEMKEGMWQAARADYDKALELRPQEASWLRARAQVLQKLGLNNAAQKDLEAAEKWNR